MTQRAQVHGMFAVNPLFSSLIGSHLLTLILDGCTEGFILLDAGGGIYFWNAWMTNITGIHSQDILGKKLVDIFPEIAGTRLARSIENVLRTGMAAVLSRTLNRTLFPLFRGTNPLEQTVYISAINTPDGRRWGVIRIADLTPAVERERFLQGQARELAAARDAAEAANKARGEFLAHISHEIRTPMNGVLGFAEMLRDTPLTDRQRRWVDTILGSGQLLLGLLNSVLDLAKIESGKFELTTRLFNLRDEVEEVLEIFGIRAQGKGVEIAGLIGDEVPEWVIGDGNRLRQILQNLISNAVKFTDHGEVVLRIEPIESDQRSVLLGFRVSDTGIGFTAEQVDRLFKPFSQAEESIAPKFGGTGLGLSISRRLVELMGGSIWAEPRDGGGAEFQFTARFGLPTPEEEAAFEGEDAGQPIPRMGSGRHRVLVAASHDAGREALVGELRRLGTEAVGISASEDVVKRGGEGWSLILLDAAWMNRWDENLPLSAPCVCLLPLTALGAPVRPGVVGELSRPVRRGALRRCLAAILAGQTFFGSGSSVSPAVTPEPGEGLSVLIVEDQPINSEVAVGMLTSMGHHAESALSAVEALERLRRRDFDLVLMDLQMPDVDGIQATRLVRDPGSGTRNPQIPIFALTAMAMAETADQCRVAGMNGFLTKPLRRSDLASIFAGLVSRSPQTSAGRAAIGEASPGKTPDLALFSLDELSHRLGGNQALVRKIIESFLAQFPMLMADLRQAVERDDTAETRRIAHAMKGTAANLAAHRLSAHLASLEEIAGAGRPGECRQVLAEVSKTWELLLSMIRERLAKG